VDDVDDLYDFDRGEWRADRTRRNQWRFWNGREWTDLVSNRGIRSVDPAGAPGVTLCLIGSVVCLRADGPVFGKRRDKLTR